MINFSEIRKRHYKITDHFFNTDVEVCYSCTQQAWPCDAITILEDFEFFREKMKFNADIVNSWIEDYEDNGVEEKSSTLQNNLLEKELIPHAHKFNCKDWRTCNCPPIVGDKQ